MFTGNTNRQPQFGMNLIVQSAKAQEYAPLHTSLQISTLYTTKKRINLREGSYGTKTTVPGKASKELRQAQGKSGQPKNYAILYFFQSHMQHKFLLVLRFNLIDNLMF